MTDLELVLGGALALAVLVIILLARYALREHRRRMKRASDAFRLGGSQKVGDLSQVLGTFAVLAQYDEVLLLSSTSAQSSLDLIGLKDDRMEFIEFKAEGASLSARQRRLRSLVSEGRLRVSYRVVDVRLPEGVEVVTRG